MHRAQHLAGPGLATTDDCDDGEEVSRDVCAGFQFIFQPIRLSATESSSMMRETLVCIRKTATADDDDV